MRKLLSGGQTGVDRGALDAALDRGFPCGGWCPAGRRAEDGAIPSRYPLQEMLQGSYRSRTRRNVEVSDATLVLTRGAPTGGTRETVQWCGRLDKPCMIVNLDRGPETAAILNWLADNDVETLNVAGPRESTCPGIRTDANLQVGVLLDALRGIAPAGRSLTDVQGKSD